MLLNWCVVCIKMLNPLGDDDGYDVNLPVELDNNIWRSSVMIWKQDTLRTDPLIQFEEKKDAALTTTTNTASVKNEKAEEKIIRLLKSYVN